MFDNVNKSTLNIPLHDKHIFHNSANAEKKDSETSDSPWIKYNLIHTMCVVFPIALSPKRGIVIACTH